MEYLVGFFIAVAVAGLAATVGMDRDRSFFPTVMIVVAAYYPLFAVMGGTGKVLEMEVLVGLGFCAVAVYGLLRNPWLVAGSIAGHGVFDCVHHLLIANAGVPVWWPGFCATVDILLGGWMAFLLWRRNEPAAARRLGENNG